MNRFTVEETNLLSIYHEGSKAQLTENINAALPYWSFCHNNSPNYILLFLSLLGYVCTVLSISQNNSYYVS